MGNNKNVPLLDITAENGPLHSQLVEAAAQVLSSGSYVMGSEVAGLEAAVATRCGTQYALGCASGSDALLLSLMAREIGSGDEVVIPSFTFFATASAVTRLGATPLFADIDPASFNMTAATIEAVVTPKTKAIIPVHLFGRAAEMPEIMALAEDRGLWVIEDAAQAIGAASLGQPVGSFGSAGCLSFYPTKNLGGFGDGGMVVTNDDEVYRRVQLLRNHGMEPRYYHNEVGVNSRLDELQAALLRIKLPHLEEWTQRRRENARTYFRLFGEANIEDFLRLPSEGDEGQHVWNQFTIRVLDTPSSATRPSAGNARGGSARDALAAYLASRKVGTATYYPVPLHQQACFQQYAHRQGELPATVQAASEVLSLPVHPQLTVEEQASVVSSIQEYFSTVRPTTVSAS